jgi:hypothetical protein
MENNDIDSLINSFTLLSTKNNLKNSININNNCQYINNLYNEIQNTKIKIIQNWVRKRLSKFNKINIKFKEILHQLQLNEEIMRKCYFEIKLISLKYPPQKNELKFIYGKLVEMSIINAFTKIGFHCNDLDKNHICGSEYKNDITLLGIDISIKAKLNKGSDVILINKKSSSNHKIEIQLLLCLINDGKLYFIPSNIVDNKIYVKEDAGCISYKGKLLTNIDKKHKEYIYTFPELTFEEKNNLKNIENINIYEKIYNETIKYIEK